MCATHFAFPRPHTVFVDELPMHKRDIPTDLFVQRVSTIMQVRAGVATRCCNNAACAQRSRGLTAAVANRLADPRCVHVVQHRRSQKEISELRRGFELQRRQIEYMTSETCTMAMLRAAMALRQDEMRSEWKREMAEVGFTARAAASTAVGVLAAALLTVCVRDCWCDWHVHGCTLGFRCARR